MPGHNDAPIEIRVVKRKKAHAGHHGGAWKVAYADFVTAMMAFFLVMWICGMSEPVKQAVAGYFKDPVAFMKMVKSGNAPFAVTESNVGKSIMHQQVSADDTEDRMRLVKAKEVIKQMIESSPEFKTLKDHIDIELVDEGLRVDLIEARESLFFDAASAKIKPAARQLLTLIAKELAKLPNKLIFEGHTDPRPLAAQRVDYTNWELSADRANSARRVMENAGIPFKQIAQVRGYAATQPRNEQDPSHYSNRRVSIIVVMKSAMKSQQFSLPDEEELMKPEVAPDEPSGISIGPSTPIRVAPPPFNH